MPLIDVLKKLDSLLEKENEWKVYASEIKTKTGLNVVYIETSSDSSLFYANIEEYFEFMYQKCKNSTHGERRLSSDGIEYYTMTFEQIHLHLTFQVNEKLIEPKKLLRVIYSSTLSDFYNWDGDLMTRDDFNYLNPINSDNPHSKPTGDVSDWK